MKNTFTSNSSMTSAETDATPKTSNSAGWIASLAYALVCTLIVLTGYEWALRSAGLEPNFRENQARWSAVRDAAGKDRSVNAIALLGASRIRSSVSLNELEDRYPDHNVYPLGYPARNPCGILHDIAETTEFRGTIVISMNANWVDCRPGVHQMHGIIDRYHKEWNWARSIDSWAADMVTQTLTFTDPSYSIPSLLENAIEHGKLLPRKKHEITRRNRQLDLDFTRLNLEQIENSKATNLRWFRWRAKDGADALPDLWDPGLSSLSETIEKINARGGQVVIVRFPTSGELRAQESHHFPRERYWDDLAAKLPASAILHFEDYSALTNFHLPDDSHLDYRDAPAFTRALFETIEQNGVAIER